MRANKRVDGTSRASLVRLYIAHLTKKEEKSDNLTLNENIPFEVIVDVVDAEDYEAEDSLESVLVDSKVVDRELLSLGCPSDKV